GIDRDCRRSEDLATSPEVIHDRRDVRLGIEQAHAQRRAGRRRDSVAPLLALAGAGDEALGEGDRVRGAIGDARYAVGRRVGEPPGAGGVLRAGRRAQAAEVVIEVRLPEVPEGDEATVDAPIGGQAVGWAEEGADLRIEGGPVDRLAGAVPAAP